LLCNLNGQLAQASTAGTGDPALAGRQVTGGSLDGAESDGLAP